MNAHVKGAPGAAAATIQVVIRRYTPDGRRASCSLAVLRKSSDVGYVEHGRSRFTIRYAREARTATGRRIDVVTGEPIFFVGGGAPVARPRAGFEVAVLRMDVDDVGLGSGVMAAAARIKSAPEGGVQIDDYAEEPIRLVTVARKLGLLAIRSFVPSGPGGGSARV